MALDRQMDTTKDGVFTTKCAHARARASFQTKRTVGEHGLVAEQTTAGAGHDRAGDLDRAELARVRAVGEQGDAVLPGVWSRKRGGVARYKSKTKKFARVATTVR